MLERSDDPLCATSSTDTARDTLSSATSIVGWEWDGRFDTARSRRACACSARPPCTGRTSGCAGSRRATPCALRRDPARTVAAGQGVGIYHTVPGARQHSGYVEATAHAQVSAYQHAGGGLVFAAGTNQWGLGLEPTCYLGGYAGAPTHGVRIPALSQLTYNVLSAWAPAPARSRPHPRSSPEGTAARVIGDLAPITRPVHAGGTKGAFWRTGACGGPHRPLYG